jgi:glycerophosphoryl diester phosphodiesterase
VAALIIAHRGGAPHLGENTAAAFEYGLASGADMLELDVQQTADGHLVVLHDSIVLVGGGHRRPVARTPLNELRRWVDGLITFEEYLEQFGTRSPANVDIKAVGFEREVVAALRRHATTEHTVVSSRDAVTLRRIKLLAPEARIGLSRGQLVPWLGREPHASIAAALLRPTLAGQLPAHASYALADSVMLHHRLASPWLIDLLHRRGMRVFCWTVNDPSTFQSLDRAGVDGIATDHPDRIISERQAS